MIKKDLYNHFDKVFQKKQQELSVEENSLLDKLVQEMYEPIKEVAEKAQQNIVEAKKAVDKAVIQGTGVMWSSYDDYGRLRQVDLIGYTQRQIKQAIAYEFTETDNALLKEVRKNWNEGKLSINERRNNLRLLESEINQVVKDAQNASKALERLKELNVDISGIQTQRETLPAIKKLSVDPCLISEEGCK